MWRRTFIRLTLLVMIVIAGLLVFAASHSPKIAATVESNCPEAEENSSNTNKAQGDFNIWESISRTLISSPQY